jgi:hypothetical protein
MRRIGIGAGLAAVAVLGLAAAAGAAPLKVLDWSSAPVQTDGSRYAMWSRSNGRTYVWDTIRNLRVAPERPAGCRQAREVVFGAGRLLWNCLEEPWTAQGWPGSVWVVGGSSSKARRARGLELEGDRYSEGGPPRLARMGKYWVYGWEPARSDALPIFYQWREGILERQQVTRRDQVADLDRPGDSPFTRLCRSIRRTPDPGYLLSDDSRAERFLPLQYEKPFAVSQKGTYPGSLVLQSCHARRRKLLERNTPMEKVQLGAGFVTWPRVAISEGTAVAVAYVPRSRRQFTWLVSGPAANLEVSHTGNRIFVSQRVGDNWLLRSTPFNPR